MAVINHLKNANQAQKYLAVAFGRQAVKGHLVWSKVAGSSPTHQITAYNALGEGEWEAIEGAFWKGVPIPAADLNFHKGALATAMTSGNQIVDSFFDKDVPHSRTAAIGYKVPVGLGNEDIENTPPLDFEGIFKTKKCPDVSEDGDIVDFSYSVNPARVIVELLLTYARLPNLPSIYYSAADYWLSRIDWGNWTDFRDFHDQTETVDYSTLEEFDGFGLTARYYTGTNFDTFITKFVHPNFDINYGSKPPAYGVAAGDFSAKFEGKITFPYSGTWTLKITVDNGTRLWIDDLVTPLIDEWSDDGMHSIGTYTETFNATAGEFYDIRADWNDGGVIGNFKMQWSHASQTEQVIPSKYLYPKPESKPLYEAHVFFEAPMNFADAIRTVLFQTNSIMQDVNGKLRFYALEDLTSSFTLDNSNIDTFKFRRRDILMQNPVTAYEADFKDLDLQYLEKPATPVRLELDGITRKLAENIKTVPMFNTTRWQARKILETRAKLEVGNGLLVEVTAKAAKTYPIVAGDLITATHRKIGETPRNYLVRESADGGVSEGDFAQGADVEKRNFVMQEWD